MIRASCRSISITSRFGRRVRFCSTRTKIVPANVLADADINIGALALGREGERGQLALTAISVDDEIPSGVRERIASLDGVRAVKVVHV